MSTNKKAIDGLNGLLERKDVLPLLLDEVRRALCGPVHPLAI